MNTFLNDPETVTALCASDHPSLPAPECSRPARMVGAQARILYVDREPALRNLGQLVLARSGYAVDTAADGVEAWAALREREYNLLVTDNQMPGLTGLELIRKVRLARMSVAVILASAMLGAYSINALPLTECGAMLAKPFTPEQLISVVGEVLRTEVGSRIITSNGPLISRRYDPGFNSHRSWGINE